MPSKKKVPPKKNSSKKPIKKVSTSKKRKSVKARVYGNNFSYFNSVRSSVKEYLQSTGAKYSLKDLNGYASSIYSGIKAQYQFGSPEFKNAIANIDIFVGQFFAGDYIGSNVDVFEWWTIGDRLSKLPHTGRVLLDTNGLLSEDNNFNGTAYNLIRFMPILNKNINLVYQRKVYVYFLQVMFRDEAKQKEFVFYLLGEEGSDELSYTESEIRDYIKANNIFNIDEVFDSCPVVPKEQSMFKTLEELQSGNMYGKREGVNLEQMEKDKAARAEAEAKRQEERNNPPEPDKGKGRKQKDKSDLGTGSGAEDSGVKKLQAEAELEREKQKTIKEQERFMKERLKTIEKYIKLGYTKKEINKLLGL
jgi:hypothetical protein